MNIWEIVAFVAFMVPLVGFILYAAFTYDHQENERWWRERNTGTEPK